jgi:hypothetical protein
VPQNGNDKFFVAFTSEEYFVLVDLIAVFMGIRTEMFEVGIQSIVQPLTQMLADEIEEIDYEYETMKSDYEAKYLAIMDNIKALVIGGRRGNVWFEGRWISYSSGSTGIINHIEGARQNGINFKPKFDTAVQIKTGRAVFRKML